MTTRYSSVLAFIQTVENYIQNAHAKSINDDYPFKITHGVLTAKHALSYPLFMNRWKKFLRAMKRNFEGFSCIRVIELYDGEPVESCDPEGDVLWLSHGLHIHFLCDKSYDIRKMQQLAWRAGLGFVVSKTWESSDPSKINTSIAGLSKYLKKQLYVREGGQKGMHKWKPVNFDGSVRVRDIFKISRWGVVYQRLSKFDWFSRFRYLSKAAIVEKAVLLCGFMGEDFQKANRVIGGLLEEDYFEGWIVPPMQLAKALLPTYHDSPYKAIDKEYDYLPGHIAKWPGVNAYLNWLQSPEGTKWAMEQHTLKVEGDKIRERERARAKRLKKAEQKRTET